jgi:hypothetical protein
MHGIAYDEVADRIIVPAQFSQAILSFRGDAKGEEPPIRVIQGPHTGLQQADRVAVDPIRKEIFVSDRGQILVFPVDANGDVTPIRAIRGPNTQLEGAPALSVDSANKLLVVASHGISIFDSTANGDVKPLRVITTGDSPGNGRLAVHNGLIFAGNRENGVGVWSVNDNGRVPTRWKIGQGVFQEIRGIAIDAKNKSVIITDKELNAVLTWYIPEVFAQMAGTKTN